MSNLVSTLSENYEAMAVTFPPLFTDLIHRVIPGDKVLIKQLAVRKHIGPVYTGPHKVEKGLQNGCTYFPGTTMDPCIPDKDNPLFSPFQLQRHQQKSRKGGTNKPHNRRSKSKDWNRSQCNYLEHCQRLAPICAPISLQDHLPTTHWPKLQNIFLSPIVTCCVLLIAIPGK